MDRRWLLIVGRAARGLLLAARAARTSAHSSAHSGARLAVAARFALVVTC